MKNKEKQIKRCGKRRRTVLIISAAALTVAIVLSVLILALGGGKTVMRAGDIKIDEELYAYWLSYSKYRYLAEKGGRDTASWWSLDAGNGISHEDACRTYAENYMAQIITAAHLFESLGGTLSEAEREALTAEYEGLLRYEVSTKKKYNDRAEEIGFDYSTLRKVLLYEKEAELLRSLLAVQSTDIDDYYKECYRNVFIIEVRTADHYVIDEEGELKQNMETGEYLRIPLTDEEKSAAEARIQRIRESMTADGSLNNFLALYREEGMNEDINILQGRYEDGYFFAPNAEFSGEFAKSLPSESDDIVGGILSDENYRTWKEYSAGDSKLFVYVTGAKDGAYESDANADFFHDLASDAADWLCATEVAKQAKDVKIDRSVADSYDIVKIKTDYMLYAK